MRMFRFFFPARDLRLMRSQNIAPLALKRRTTITTTTTKMTNKQKGKEKKKSLVPQSSSFVQHELSKLRSPLKF